MLTSSATHVDRIPLRFIRCSRHPFRKYNPFKTVDAKYSRTPLYRLPLNSNNSLIRTVFLGPNSNKRPLKPHPVQRPSPFRPIQGLAPRTPMLTTSMGTAIALFFHNVCWKGCSAFTKPGIRINFILSCDIRVELKQKFKLGGFNKPQIPPKNEDFPRKINFLQWNTNKHAKISGYI